MASPPSRPPHTAPRTRSEFMGIFSSASGVCTVCLLAFSHSIFKHFPWGVAAAITPVTIGITGLIFFSLLLAPSAWAPVAALTGTTPLMLAVVVGGLQNALSKSASYALFYPSKEMAYIQVWSGVGPGQGGGHWGSTRNERFPESFCFSLRAAP